MTRRLFRPAAAAALALLAPAFTIAFEPPAPIVAATRQMTLEGRWDDAERALRLEIGRARRSGDSRRAAVLLVELARVAADRNPPRALRAGA